MKKKMMITLIALIRFFQAGAAGDFQPAGGRSSGTGFCSVTYADTWSALNNPAGLGFLTGISAGFYGGNRFLLKELSHGAAAAALAFRPVTLGLGVTRFGADLCPETRICLSAGRRFGSRFGAGIRFGYLRLSQPEPYDSKGIITCEAGLLYRPDSRWSAGVHILNPVPVRYGPGSFCRLPSILRFGASYEWCRKVLVLAGIEAALPGASCIQAGIEYRLVPRFCARIGFRSDPVTMTAGGGFEFGRWIADISSSWQPVLGYSPQISIGYRMGRENIKPPRPR